MIKEKKCKVCKEIKIYKEFYTYRRKLKSRRISKILFNICKKCVSKRNKEKYKENPQKYIARSLIYIRRNKK